MPDLQSPWRDPVTDPPPTWLPVLARIGQSIGLAYMRLDHDQDNKQVWFSTLNSLDPIQTPTDWTLLTGDNFYTVITERAKTPCRIPGQTLLSAEFIQTELPFPELA